MEVAIRTSARCSPECRGRGSVDVLFEMLPTFTKQTVMRAEKWDKGQRESFGHFDAGPSLAFVGSENVPQNSEQCHLPVSKPEIKVEKLGMSDGKVNSSRKVKR